MVVPRDKQSRKKTNHLAALWKRPMRKYIHTARIFLCNIQNTAKGRCCTCDTCYGKCSTSLQKNGSGRARKISADILITVSNLSGQRVWIFGLGHDIIAELLGCRAPGSICTELGLGAKASHPICYMPDREWQGYLPRLAKSLCCMGHIIWILADSARHRKL